MRRLFWVFGFLVAFVVGVGVWRLANPTRVSLDLRAVYLQKDLTSAGVIMEIDGEAISGSDVEFEYDLMVDQQQGGGEEKPESEDEEGEAIISVENPHADNAIKQGILQSLVERRALVAAIKQDSAFDFESPARYVGCLEEWLAASKASRGRLDQAGQERLKEIICEKSLIEQYLSEKLYKDIELTDEEIRNYFDEHRDSFRRPPLVVVRQIVVGSEGEARRLKGKVTSRNFALMAKEHSLAPEKDAGGLLGPFALHQMPSFLDSAFQMKVGAISDVVKSAFGFHIIMLEERYDVLTSNTSFVRRQIVDRLTQGKREELYQRWINASLRNLRITAHQVGT